MLSHFLKFIYKSLPFALLIGLSFYWSLVWLVVALTLAVVDEGFSYLFIFIDQSYFDCFQLKLFAKKFTIKLSSIQGLRMECCQSFGYFLLKYIVKVLHGSIIVAIGCVFICHIDIIWNLWQLLHRSIVNQVYMSIDVKRWKLGGKQIFSNLVSIWNLLSLLTVWSHGAYTGFSALVFLQEAHMIKVFGTLFYNVSSKIVTYLNSVSKWFHAFKSQKLYLIFQSEIVYEIERGNLLHTQWEVEILVDCLHEPLLNCVTFIFCPKLLHKISSSFRNVFVILKSLPKTYFIHGFAIIWAHDLEEHEALNYSELLLLTNIQLFTLLRMTVDQETIVFDRYHLITSDFIWVSFEVVDCFFYPCALINWTSVEIFHLKFCWIWSYLVSEALILVYNHSSMIFYPCFKFIVFFSTLGNVKH